MRCPSCQFENPPQAKFCLECGARLAPAAPPRCPNCGLELPAGAKFCLECGTRLDDAPAPSLTPEQALAERLKRLVPKEYAERLLSSHGRLSGERRTVSILFCDVKGSTAIARDMDPEDVLDIMNGAFEVLIPPVYRQEGTLARLMGDAILAFFGAPIAHEDDAERACRAGLEILAGARQYAEALRQERGLEGFNVRVGINTGLVVMGEVGSDLRVEYTAMGDAINLAARMEQNAAPGSILVTAETHTRVQYAFETQALEPVLVKGHDEAVPVFRILSARRRGFRNLGRGVQGIQTRMVGRQAELEALQETCRAAAAERLAVTIFGDPGIGKSRLLLEFENWLDQAALDVQTWRGASRAELQSTPFALLRDLVQTAFNLEDGEPPENTQHKLEQGFCQHFATDGPARAAWVGALLGLALPPSPHLGAHPAPQEVHDRARRYLLELLQAGPKMPLVFLEDIHWADDSSLSLLADLAAPGAMRKPGLFIFISRPTLLERRPTWAEEIPGMRRIDLKPLAEQDSHHLVADILQKLPDPPAGLRQQIITAAEGSPLFLEELVKVLIQEGVITCAEEAWTVHAERLKKLSLPPSLAGILQARIDGLPPDERQALQQAAILGRLFWDQALAHLAQAPLAEVTRLLQTLDGRELVYQQAGSQLRGAKEFIFKHAALRDVAYESSLKKTRRQYHAQAAAWLVALPEPEALAGMIAEHYELAGQAHAAIPWLQRAAERAARGYANLEAEKFFSRALALLEGATTEAVAAMPVMPDQRWALLLGREAVRNLSDQRQAQAADLAALEALAATSPARQAEVALRRTHYYEETGDYAACQAAAEQAVAYAQQAGEAELHLRALLRLGVARQLQGSLEAAEETLRQALELAQPPANPSQRANCLYNLASVRYYLGDCDGALALFEDSLHLSRQLADRQAEASVLRSLAAAYHDLHRLDQAAQAASQAVEIYHLTGDRSGETQALINQANILRALGRFEEAHQAFDQSLALAQEIHSVFSEELAANNLALLWLDLDQPAQAVQAAQRAIDLARQIEDRIGVGYALTALGLALEACQDPEAASQAYSEALALRRELEQPALAVDDLAGLARCALMQNDFETADGRITEAMDWVQANALEGVEDPMRLLWTASWISALCGRPEAAAQTRQTAQSLLASWAEAIQDPAARRSFLNDIPLHKIINAET